MKYTLRILLINVAFFCTIMVSLEIVGQLFFYAKKGQFVFQDGMRMGDENHHRELFEYHPYYVGRLKKNVSVTINDTVVSTTEYHTRYTGAPENDDELIRIAVLGGSTTFGTKVSDLDSWPAQLQAKLGPGYSIRNYGGPGYSTAEAVVQLALVVPEWKPDYVILYQGWNDIRNYFDETITPDYYSHGSMQRYNLRLPLYEKNGGLEEALRFSDIVRLVRHLSYKFHRKEDELVEIYSVPDPKVDEIYLGNLELLRVLSDHISASVIFVPQILNDEYYLNTEERSIAWSPHIKSDAMPELMAHFNSLMSTVCEEGDPQCVFLKSVLEMDWQQEDFVDRGHFSPEGGAKFSDGIVSYITDNSKKE